MVKVKEPMRLLLRPLNLRSEKREAGNLMLDPYFFQHLGSRIQNLVWDLVISKLEESGLTETVLDFEILDLFGI